MTTMLAAGAFKVGVDLLYLDELDELARRPWFRRFVYCPGEQELAECLTSSRRREFLAGRFAAKEAVLKVLGSGLFQGVLPREIAVYRDPRGEPSVALRGTAERRARQLGIVQVTVSLAHKRDLVIATALGAVTSEEGSR